jgi:hypothetical protein
VPWRVCRSVADSPHFDVTRIRIHIKVRQADPDPHQVDADPQIVLQRPNPESSPDPEIPCLLFSVYIFIQYGT